MNFITKTSRGGSREPRKEDVMLSVNKTGGGRSGFVLAISFRAKVKSMVFGNSEYAVIAFSDDGERIYFDKSDKFNGFKLSKSNTGNLFNLKVPITNEGNMSLAACKNWCGYYNVEFCAVENLWCVSLERKIVV